MKERTEDNKGQKMGRRNEEVKTKGMRKMKGKNKKKK